MTRMECIIIIFTYHSRCSLTHSLTYSCRSFHLSHSLFYSPQSRGRELFSFFDSSMGWIVKRYIHESTIWWNKLWITIPRKIPHLSSESIKRENFLHFRLVQLLTRDWFIEWKEEKKLQTENFNPPQMATHSIVSGRRVKNGMLRSFIKKKICTKYITIFPQ